MAKRNYICRNTIIGSDDLEGRFTKRPGEVVKLDPTDKDTIRLVRIGAIVADGDEGAVAPANQRVPMENVDTTGQQPAVDDLDVDTTGQQPAVDDLDEGDDDGLGDDPTPDPTPKAEAVAQAAAKKPAAKPKR